MTDKEAILKEAVETTVGLLTDQFQETEACITKEISVYHEFFHSNYDYMSSVGAYPQIPLYDYDLITNSTAFMLGPICLYDKKVHEAGTFRCDSLNELKEYLKDKQYLLYYAYVRYGVVSVTDSTTFELKQSETSKASFYFRGSILSK